jgi:hypothetical protein
MALKPTIHPTFVAETAAQATYVVGSGQSSFIVAN